MKKLFSLIVDEPQGRTHYRSKLYTSKIGVNPLVTAAHPLFSILERINLSEKPPELTALQANLSHELQAFMTKAHTSEHLEETIVAARYLLCATIDEVIDKAYHKHQKDSEKWEEKEVLVIEQNEFSNELKTSKDPSSINITSSDTHFFQILEKAMNKPDFYLDVIELTYFCIITGFEGKYRTDPNGKQDLENLLDKLYQIIQEQKPPSAEKLFVQASTTRRFISIKSFPWKWVTSILVSIIAAGYFMASYQLNQQAAHVLQSSQASKNAAPRTY